MASRMRGLPGAQRVAPPIFAEKSLPSVSVLSQNRRGGGATRGKRIVCSAFSTHLTENGVNLRKTKMSLGTWLDIDSKAERFTGGNNVEKANALVKREYREPFVIREKV